MKHSTRRFLSLLVSVIVIFAAGFVYIGLVQPTYDEIGMLRAELAQKESTLAARNELAKQIKKLIDQYGGKDQAIIQMTTALPESPDIAAVLAQLQGIAQESGVIVNDIGLSQQGNVSAGTAAQSRGSTVLPLGVLSFNLSIAGPYDAMSKFVTSLEQSVRIMDVKTLSFTPERDRDGSAMKAELRVSAYYQKSPEATTKN